MDDKALRARALAALALREHSRAELRRKLLRALQRAAERAAAQADEQDKEPDAEPSLEASGQRVDHLLDALQAQGLLSEQRYMESRLRTRAPRLGARRLAAELAQQGVQPGGEAWQQVQATEAERAAALLARRFGDSAPADARDFARRVRFLVARGFASELALRLVKGSRR